MQLEMYSTLACSKLNPSEPRADAEHYSMKAQRDKTGDQSISYEGDSKLITRQVYSVISLPSGILVYKSFHHFCLNSKPFQTPYITKVTT